VKSALGAICKLNDQRNGVAQGILPEGRPCENPASLGFGPEAHLALPSFDVGHYASLLITHGYADRGLFCVQKNYKNIHGRRGRTFNQPFAWDLATNDATGWGDERYMGAPSVWHVLYAMQGFHLNVPDGTLWLRPHLPIGVYTLSAPLFTPLCFGWMKFREDDDKAYRQVVHLSFDSPVSLKTIVLRVPEEVEEVKVECESSDGDEEVHHIFGYDGAERLVEIIAKKPIMVGNLLKLRLTQTLGKPFRFPTPAAPARPEPRRPTYLISGSNLASMSDSFSPMSALNRYQCSVCSVTPPSASIVTRGPNDSISSMSSFVNVSVLHPKSTYSAPLCHANRLMNTSPFNTYAAQPNEFLKPIFCGVLAPGSCRSWMYFEPQIQRGSCMSV